MAVVAHRHDVQRKEHKDGALTLGKASARGMWRACSSVQACPPPSCRGTEGSRAVRPARRPGPNQAAGGAQSRLLMRADPVDERKLLATIVAGAVIGWLVTFDLYACF
jgi:hypothetical protein